MNKTTILELIAASENTRVEFKRDDCHPEDLGKEMCGLLNGRGGIILLGVEDDGQISGLSRNRKDAEEWVMNIARQNVDPSIIPFWSCIKVDDAKLVGVIELQSDRLEKPYAAKRGRSWNTYIRAGTTTRKPTKTELGRLFQSSGILKYEVRAVPDTDFASLDMDRIENYFGVVLNRTTFPRTDKKNWLRLLLNSDLLIQGEIGIHATVAGLLLFGTQPNRRLPQAGITAVAFPDLEKEYSTIDEACIRGPLTSIVSDPMVAKGVIDHAVDFVERNMGTVAWLDSARRRRRPAYPIEAIREAIVNAVVHRDYTREGTDIEVSMYRDRIEIISPGNLSNGVTVEKMQEGVVRDTRNPLLRDILRDYGYVESIGMGVRNRIISVVRKHNGLEPELLEQDDRFVVRIRKELRE